MSIKLECHEANHFCDKNQYKEATFWEKVKLNIHLIYCRACRKYTAKNMKLSKALRKSHIKAMPESDKSLLKEKIQKELSSK